MRLHALHAAVGELPGCVHLEGGEERQGRAGQGRGERTRSGAHWRAKRRASSASAGRGRTCWPSVMTCARLSDTSGVTSVAGGLSACMIWGGRGSARPSVLEAGRAGASWQRGGMHSALVSFPRRGTRPRNPAAPAHPPTYLIQGLHTVQKGLGGGAVSAQVVPCQA